MQQVFNRLYRYGLSVRATPMKVSVKVDVKFDVAACLRALALLLLIVT